MNIFEHIRLSLQYRWTRIVFHLWIKPIKTIAWKKWEKPIVASIVETLNHIIEHKSSICRLGDGEFELIWGKNLGFQRCTPEISRRMKEVLESHEENILICIPEIFGDLHIYTHFTKKFWTEYRLVNLEMLQNILISGHRYYNSQITRLIDFAADKTDVLIPLFRKIWDKRDVYIIEGEQTRIGVGNDLLDNASNIYRILAPRKNAYYVYDKIVASVKVHAPEGALVIIALGPTATIMAYDLAKMGYQALDIGHLDIQYECHIRGVDSKTPIPGKYVNEAGSTGQTVDDTIITDERYETSIIDIIK